MKQDSETEMLKEYSEQEYKYGFVSDIESETLPPGLNEDTIRFISKKKGEPEWLTDWRLKAFEIWKKMEEPHWANIEYPPIDYQAISYYSAPKNLDDAPKSLDEVDPKLLDTYNEKRRKSADIYTSFFKNNPKIITPKVVGDRNSHVFHQYTLRIINSDRDALSEYLISNKIPFGIYYPVPLHLQKAYADKRFKEENFGITNQLINEVISLPMHSELSLEQIDYISDKINKFLT